MGASKDTPFNPGERPMLYWALMFLVVALIAAIFGFGGIASRSCLSSPSCCSS